MQLNDLRCLSRVYCLILASSLFWSVMVLKCIGQFIKLEGDLGWVVFFVVFALFALYGFIFSAPSFRNIFDGKVIEEKHYNLRRVLIEIVFLSGKSSSVSGNAHVTVVGHGCSALLNGKLLVEE